MKFEDWLEKSHYREMHFFNGKVKVTLEAAWNAAIRTQPQIDPTKTEIIRHQNIIASAQKIPCTCDPKFKKVGLCVCGKQMAVQLAIADLTNYLKSLNPELYLKTSEPANGQN